MSNNLKEEDEEQEIQKITYGAVISISHFQDDNAFIQADGHINQEVYLQNYGMKKLISEQKSDKKLQKRNFTNCLFIIYPKSSNLTKQEILQQLNLDTDGEIVQRDSPILLDQEQIAMYQTNLLKEYKYNFDSFQKSSTLDVCYSQAVQLMHLNSGKFLACHTIEAEHEKENFHVTLDDYTSDATMWKFVPSFKYQKDGDQVIFANEITWIERYIPIHNKKTCLHSSTENIKELKHEQLKSPKQDPKQLLKKQPKQSQILQKQKSIKPDHFKGQEITKREVNASIEDQPTSWKINLFHEFPSDEDEFLRCGDVVWLHHSEANSIITSSRQDKGVDKYNFTSLNINTWLSQNNLKISVQQSSTGDEFSDYSGNTFGMFVLLYENQQLGGFIEYGKNYRIKHLSSGSYLSVQNIQKKGKEEEEFDGLISKYSNTLDVSRKNKQPPGNAFELKLSSVPDETTLFQFGQLQTDKMKSHDKRIKSGCFSFIENIASKKYLDVHNQTGLDHKTSKKFMDFRYKPILKTQRNDNQLFRLYKSHVDEQWEINYVISCFKTLSSFIVHLQKLHIKSDSDEGNMHVLIDKIIISQKCVQELTLFVRNKLGNSRQEEKFGTINDRRQKLLREQYFIDILIKILEDALPKEDLNQWINMEKQLKDMDDEIREKMASGGGLDEKQKKNAAKDGKIDQREFLDFINKKVEFCIDIYMLLISLCKDNPENEITTFNLIPFFQIHAKYIPQAIECISEICRYNEDILYKLTENLKINFDHIKQEAIKKDESKTIKFLINLYDGQEYNKKQEDIQKEHVQFRQHEKLTAKPINLLQYFMNLLWDESAPIKESYLSFLSSICVLGEKGMSLNQENVFKLYKTYNNIREQLSPDIFQNNLDPEQQLIQEQQKQEREIDPNDPKSPAVKYDMKKLQKIKDCFETEQDRVYIASLIQFYSSVAYGRNFLWREELKPFFNPNSLYQQLWDPQSSITIKGAHTALTANFCQLINALFIDHDPLQKVNTPNFCRLYSQCHIPYPMVKLNQQQTASFELLLEKVKEYFNSTFMDMEKIINISAPQVDKKSKAKSAAFDASNLTQASARIGNLSDSLITELLRNSTSIFYTLLRLNIFEIMGNHKKYYSEMLKYLLTYLQYSKNNLKFVGALYKTDSKNTLDRKKKKNNVPGFSGISKGFSSFTSMISKAASIQKEEEDDGDGSHQDIQLGQDVNENTLFYNPIMRGFIKLNNSLEDVFYEDSYKIQSEISIKTTACEVISYYLDLRQDYLMTNVLNFFKEQIIGQEQRGEEFFENNFKTILPNIAKTGITSVDEIYKAQEDSITNFTFSSEKKKQKWKRFIKGELTNEPTCIQGIEDIDSLLSRAIGDTKTDDNPSAAILPKLLSAFILVTDDGLQKIILKIILRLFNQRLELRANLQQMLILFDNEKTQIYNYCQDQIQKLKKLIERSEIWLAQIHSTKDKHIQEIQEIISILGNLKNGFYKNTFIIDERLCMQKNTELEIDSDKQKLLRYLNLHTTIISLINDGIPHLSYFLMDPKVSQKTKEDLIIMFTLAHQCLKIFVTSNSQNQKLLIGEVNLFLRFAKFDLGQIPLVCEIYRNNLELLEHFNKDLLKTFIDLIINEGRQSHFLEIFECTQSITLPKAEGGDFKTDFLFENQLMVLNSFIPLQNIGEKEIKLMYADGSKDDKINLYFEDITRLEEINFLQKLKEVDFRDTYRDEPFVYHSRLLDLILKTTIDQCTEYSDIQQFLDETKIIFNISINKVKKSFSMQYLVSLLNQPDDYIRGVNQKSKKEELDIIHEENLPLEQRDLYKESKYYKMVGFSYLKPHILNFLRCVHILSDKDLVNNVMGDLGYDQKIFIQYIEQERRRIQNIQNNQSFTDEYTEYLFEYLMSTLIAYVEKYFPQKKKLIFDMNSEDIRKDMEVIYQFSKELYNQYPKFSQRITARQEINAQKLLGQFILDAKEIEIEKRPINEVVMIKKERNEYNKVIDYVEVEDPNKKRSFNRIQNAVGMINVVTKFQAKKHKEKQLQDESYHLSQLKIGGGGIGGVGGGGGKLSSKQNLQEAWENFLFRMENPSVDEEIKDERKALADSLLKINELCSSEMAKHIEPKPSLELVLKKLIDFMITSVEDASNKSTNIALIQVMIEIITKEEDQKKVQIQNLFERLGGIKMVLFVISEDHENFDGDLFLSFLIFINQLLEGGNKRNQQAVYEYFTTYKKSEIIFKKFQGYFNKQINSLQAKAKKKRIEQSKKKKGAQADPDDEEDMDDDAEDIFCNQQDIDILGEILNFLQNCVEGHYLELQNYLRNQWNQRNKYDMVMAVADLLKTYYQDARTQDMYENMLKCLDTLSEFIQGPCPDNQVAVSESKFFEICQDIFSIQEKSEDKSTSTTMRTKKSTAAMKTRKSSMGKTIRTGAKLEEWHITRLQNKCLILVLSLLEKRDVTTDKTVIKQIIRHLPVSVFEHHLIGIYEKFIKQYKLQYRIECLQHLNGEPDPNEEIENDEEEEQQGCCQRISKAIYNFFIKSCFTVMKVLGLAREKILDKEKYSFVLQNGFYIFFIFSYYMESGIRLEGEIVTYYKEKQKQVIENKKSLLERFLQADNVISQIFNLVWSLIQSILLQLYEMQRQALEVMLKKSEEDEEQKKKLVQSKLEERQRLLKETFKFFFEKSAHIDVVRGNELEQIYFIKLPYTFFLPNSKKNEFNDNIDRSNMKAKVEGLVEASVDLIEICKHEEILHNYFQKNKILAIFANHVKLWQDLAFFFTLILNMFILLSYSSVFKSRDPKKDGRFWEPRLFMAQSITKEETENYFFIFGLCMTCCSFFVVSFFLMKNLPLIFNKIWNKDKTEITGLIQGLYSIIKKLLIIIIQILQEIELIYYLAYGFFAFLGTFWHPFCFVFHLTEILLRYPTLKSVIRSVVEPREQLGLTFILFIIVLFIFTLIGHQWFRENYHEQCEDLTWCFMFMLDTCFKSNAGIGGWMSEQNDDDEGHDFTTERMFFDTLFNIIILVILINIVSGIIIDKFGELRQMENDRMEDIEDKCFICANKKTEFDRQSQGGFKQHIKIYHYMWNYMFYIAYLSWKDPNDYTGVESYVNEKLSKKDTSWFPLLKARELINLDEQNKKDLKNEMVYLKDDFVCSIRLAKNVNKKLGQLQQQQY